MAYERGELQIGAECPSRDEEGYCDCDSEDYHSSYLAGVAYLPHSCDEWQIGGSKEVQMLIDDLQVALVLLKEAGK